jgi:uncharacterized protein YndB with AHSA1/START domain
MPSTTVPGLVMRRTYEAPPERVYQAWTQPELAQQFLCPGDVKIAEIQLDVRVGGTYRIVMQQPDGEQLVVSGVYREVKPASKLSMTWKWEEDDPKDEHESLVSLDFAPHGNGTELTLRHELLASVESRNNHEHGWSLILDNLTSLR